MKEGWNVLLISRSQEKLTRVVSTLSESFPLAKLDTFVLDAGCEAEEMNFLLKELSSKKLEGKDVGLLINNVGVTEKVFGWFGEELPEEEFLNDAIRTIRINCVFSSKLTSLVLPKMKSRNSENKDTNIRSGVINLSSILGIIPSPFSPIYGASKAYNRTFSRALAAEYTPLRIDVLCVSPGMVTSNLTGMKESTWYCATAASTVRYSLRALGAAIEIIPHPIHGMTYFLSTVLNWLPVKTAAVLSALLLRFLPKPPGIRVSPDFQAHPTATQ